MDIHMSNDAAVILSLAGFAITCVYFAGRIFLETLRG